MVLVVVAGKLCVVETVAGQSHHRHPLTLALELNEVMNDELGWALLAKVAGQHLVSFQVDTT